MRCGWFVSLKRQDRKEKEGRIEKDEREKEEEGGAFQVDMFGRGRTTDRDNKGGLRKTKKTIQISLSASTTTTGNHNSTPIDPNDECEEQITEKRSWLCLPRTEETGWIEPRRLDLFCSDP